MSIFDNCICTYYKHRAAHGINRPILDILSKEGYTNNTLLNQVRSYAYGSDEYKKQKSNLSCATFSSIQKDLTIYHCEENHLMHTQFIQFDLDVNDNPYLAISGGREEIMNLIISKSPWVCYMGASISGIGLWGLVAIENGNRHTQQYDAFSTHLRTLELVPDIKTKNVASFRFLSYDPDGYFDLNAIKFDGYEIGNHLTDYENTSNYYTRKNPSDELFMAACRWVEAKHNLTFTKGNIHNYIVSLCGCLISAHVSRDDAEGWIYRNLITQEEITTNCIKQPYESYIKK